MWLKNFFSMLTMQTSGTGKTTTIISILATLLMEKQQEKAKKKILVCAPSNAAIDELIGRLKDGIETATGIKLNPRIVRLGRPEVVTGSAKTLQSKASWIRVTAEGN